MITLNEYLVSKEISPDDIMKSTGLQTELIGELISGNVDIMDLSFGSVLLLSNYLQLPLSEFASYCASQGNIWQITTENGWHNISFKLGDREYKQPIPVTDTNTKYIRHIAFVFYHSLLDDIIEAKKGRISEYRKRVELELRKIDEPDWVISLVDNEDIEPFYEAGFTPEEAAAKLRRE